MAILVVPVLSALQIGSWFLFWHLDHDPGPDDLGIADNPSLSANTITVHDEVSFRGDGLILMAAQFLWRARQSPLTDVTLLTVLNPLEAPELMDFGDFCRGHLPVAQSPTGVIPVRRAPESMDGARSLGMVGSGLLFLAPCYNPYLLPLVFEGEAGSATQLE
ncbi:uncharacterized protein B0I36DRAFT_349089 [Microdochium trichocladiopsis]|uniref:Uncharacterized protein n=1 Tax=Microdochium trichocladiopsis TaxID=1682393 RepID=A0A9P8Y5X8_9PEZI|nr:uncharacterized protein B0I36DRAFT_349089 [Microdochium trichocladiopsis]KAH7030926.1 hypothetical protein B0I36DRAFT_349089 [Microdochium trichocladiopsis]